MQAEGGTCRCVCKVNVPPGQSLALARDAAALWANVLEKKHEDRWDVGIRPPRQLDLTRPWDNQGNITGSGPQRLGKGGCDVDL